jgi:beta-lactamase regulating signal transducer with metallopeptidase domain
MTFDAVDAAWFVLETSLRALAAALAVGLVLRLVRVRAAAVLHSAWRAVLVAMLLMPVLPSIVPALPVPVPAAAGDLFDAASATEEPSPAVVGQSTPARHGNNAVPSSTHDSPRLSDRRPASDLGARGSRSWLPPVLLTLYAAGVFLCVTRLSYGWLLASAMVRRAMRRGPVRTDVGRPVYESPEVTVPMTVGAMRPVIVLPVGWRAWDSQTLAAIIAHEAAHVRRHDAAMAFAAHLNRAVFWFHPLAWWLERTLAVTAEHACDEFAARTIEAPARYAEILVEMADSTAASIACFGATRSPARQAGRSSAWRSGASSPSRWWPHAASRSPPRRSARIRSWRSGSRTRTRERKGSPPPAT